MILAPDFLLWQRRKSEDIRFSYNTSAAANRARSSRISLWNESAFSSDFGSIIATAGDCGGTNMGSDAAPV